ncbi:hypothetical protein N7466_010070 [Penicillium verhagenii]|uniref:uncharacterized protein n=1 Tax=Penicillium verhagenii TaxID=1562060 RepID=UPI00254598C8|nr:uncharacterized protein N7466_010070 [Penicillium verhagenii]KAJ5919127.1 hypothetical protein N7466_010070 [Penicillium verhagenii]
MGNAKRVVLRLAEADWNQKDFYEPVRLYLEKHGRSPEELEAKRHFIHIQPPSSDIPIQKSKIYIVIDIEKDEFAGPLSSDFPHDIREIRREDGNLYVPGIIGLAIV